MPSIIEQVIAQLDRVPDAPDNNECIDMAADLIAMGRITNFTSWWQEIQDSDVTEDDISHLQQKLKEIISKPVSEDCIAGAIWALGKSHDPSLKPYFVSLIQHHIDPPCYDALHQTIVSIDNFEDVIMRFGYDGLSSFEKDKILNIAQRLLDDVQ